MQSHAHASRRWGAVFVGVRREKPRRWCAALIMAAAALMAAPAATRADLVIAQAGGRLSSALHQQGAYAQFPSLLAPRLDPAVCREAVKGALIMGQEKLRSVAAATEGFVFGACGGAAGVFLATQRACVSVALAAVQTCQPCRVERCFALSHGLTVCFRRSGAATMFPVEAVKMRMQALGSEATFKSVLRSALKTEGLAGLYQGVRATVVGVAPEKAVMFGVNSALRPYAAHLEDERGLLPVPVELAIGGLAGAGQVLFSSPKEMVMVQMQMASQAGVAQSANNPLVHIRKLGLRNMYRGCTATLLRDVPFAALYFAAYGRIKVALQGSRDRCVPAPFVHVVL